MIGKLLSVATAGGTLAGMGASMGLLHRFLTSLAQAMILVIVSAFMLCGSLASLFYILYFCLEQAGLPPQSAGLIVGIVALAVTALVVAFTLLHLRSMQRLNLLQQQGPERSGLDLQKIIVSFIDGFLTKNTERR